MAIAYSAKCRELKNDVAVVIKCYINLPACAGEYVTAHMESVRETKHRSSGRRQAAVTDYS